MNRRDDPLKWGACKEFVKNVIKYHISEEDLREYIEHVLDKRESSTEVLEVWAGEVETCRRRRRR